MEGCLRSLCCWMDQRKVEKMSGGRTDCRSRVRVKTVDLVAIVEAQKAVAAAAVEVAAGMAAPGMLKT